MPRHVLFDKQAQFYESQNRINAYIGGIQSGKTTSGALKMVSSILKYRDPMDNFIVAADTYKTLSQATLPKFFSLAKGLGKPKGQAAEFKTVWGSTVYLRTATHPDSLEGITNVRRIWIDEAGKTSKYFFENAMGRAAFRECEIDLTTTPYALNWLASLCRESENGKRPDVGVVTCRSIDSPYFPKEEFERQKRLLDPRRFAMKYEGKFGKMEGLVFDVYDQCLMKSIPLPIGTQYYGGVDWGYSPDPFCLTVRAITPEKRHYRVFEYYKNFLTISDIVRVVKGFHSIYNFKMLYCDPSQPAHIDELNRSSIPATGANNDIRFGIDKHYELMKSGNFWIFEDLNPLGIDEYSTYRYREPRELKLEEDLKDRDRAPVDQNNHGIDADRYCTLGTIHMTEERREPRTPINSEERPMDLAKKIEWLKRRHLA